jgi:hypothetical protein
MTESVRAMCRATAAIIGTTRRTLVAGTPDEYETIDLTAEPLSHRRPFRDCSYNEVRSHLLWVLERAEIDGAVDVEKTQRWIGFVRGVCWCMGLLERD